ncbi:hypothetical protein BJX63DRAFT_292324 [Aspergillus granulosus]|uniref:Mtf2-like C-terminal domain-containing protein n=1 Tax=Aspergillus granulosus TaxID=176169 RepID=A0ABR4H8L2_9EURO
MSLPRRITWTWLAQVQETRHSLVPFLYQTRTLTTLPRSLRLQSHSRYSTFKAAKAQIENDGISESTLEDKSDLPDEPGSAPRNSFLRQKAASVASRRMARKPSWKRSPIKKPANRPTKPALESALEGSETTSKPKMTIDETRAFAALFQQLEEDTGTDIKQTLGGEGMEKGGSSMPDRDMMQEITSIYDTVMRDINARKKAEDSQDPTPKSQAHPEYFEAVPDAVEPEGTSVTPSSGNKEPEESEKLDAPLKHDPDRVHKINNKLIRQIIHREGLKIERALFSAAVDEGQGDIGIWNICKERIFSMVQHLETDENKEATPSAPDELEFPVPGRDGPSETETPTTNPHLEVPDTVSIEAVVTELYPKMLLVAFRLLNLHFPESPLIGQFRSTINSLGRESAVLGSSTALYNELIYFYWRGRQDLPEVLSILREMDVLGLSPDQQTVKLLESILAQREQDLEARKLPGADQNSGLWWDLPQNRKAIHDLDGKDGLICQMRSQVRSEEDRRKWLRELLNWKE